MQRLPLPENHDAMRDIGDIRAEAGGVNATFGLRVGGPSPDGSVNLASTDPPLASVTRPAEPLDRSPAMPRIASPAERSVDGSRNLPIVSDRMLGVALMAVVPALFWSLLAIAVAPLFGIDLAAGTVFQIAAGVAVFLGIVATAVTARAS